MTKETCKGKTKAGKPCRSPIVDADGYCPAHGVDGTARMRQRGAKGGDATRKTFQWCGAVCGPPGASGYCLGRAEMVEVDRNGRRRA